MKRRILIGLTPLFILLVAMGLYAVALFAKLGSRVDVILRENFRSVVAGQQMKEAAERMDSAFAFTLAGEEERGRKLHRENLALFEENLRLELGNITLPGEGELAQKVRHAHENYAARAKAFWSTPDLATRQQMYFGEMLPALAEIKDNAQKIIRLNEENMVQADRDARQLAAQSTRYMIVALAVGLGGSAFFAARLQRSILQPIRALTTVSKDMGEGQLDQVVPVSSRDELGQLADTFNKMATKLRAYRQMMGDQVLQARQMTEITFSAFPDPIIALSAEGRIDFTNPAANEFLGRLEQRDSLPSNVQSEVERVLRGAPDYLPQSFERVLVFRVNDREVFMLPRVIGMRQESGQLFGAAVILQDVTRLRLLDEVKTNLVSTVSHELKTPLTSVRMGLHLLLEERIGTLNNQQTELLLAAREDSERLLRMINDLLDLAKLESGGGALPGRRVEPQALVKTACQELQALVEAHGSRLAMVIEPGLPPVSVDREQIAHVFSNLVSNALKYSRAGEEIVLKAATQGDAVRFSIIDHGTGIPAEYQERLFERFFRVPGVNVTGAGLGLAIAREIILSQGGTIGVHSTPGAGSEFFFDLPSAGKSSRL